MAKALVRFGPQIYSLLGGILISLAGSQYVAAVTPDPAPTAYADMMLSSLLLLLAGIGWAALAWIVEPIYRLAVTDAPNWVSESEALKSMLQGRRTRVVVLFVASIGLTSVGFFILGVR